MKKVKVVNGYKVMQVTPKDNEYREDLPQHTQFMLFDNYGDEAGIGLDTLEMQVEFAKTLPRAES